LHGSPVDGLNLTWDLVDLRDGPSAEGESGILVIAVKMNNQ